MSNSSQLIAIGLAFRLPKTYEDNCRWLSQKFDPLYLDLSDNFHIPHITLIQMTVKRSDLPVIYQIINSKKKETVSVNINTKKFISCGEWGDEECWGLEIVDYTTMLYQFAKNLWNELSKFSYDVSSLTLNQIGFFEPVSNKKILDYLTNFHYRLNHSEFLPHITLGFLQKGIDPPNMGLNLLEGDFQLENIELFHLGNYGAMCPLYFLEDEIYISHRINTVEELIKTPTEYGVELDIRDSPDGSLRIVHDAGLPGENFETYIEHFFHRWIILNVKAERVEAQILQILQKYGIENYFFLDSSFPMIYLLCIKGDNPKMAIRFSEYEPLEMAKQVAGHVDWVWVDCFTEFPLTREAYLKLRSWGYKICLVSPELQGYSDSCIESFLKQMKDSQIYFDMVCTKERNIKTWQKQN